MSNGQDVSFVAGAAFGLLLGTFSVGLIWFGSTYGNPTYRDGVADALNHPERYKPVYPTTTYVQVQP